VASLLAASALIIDYIMTVAVSISSSTAALTSTLAQYGMLKKWSAIKKKNWQYKCWINGFGALVTLVVSIIVFSTKFIGGAWILAIAIPGIMILMNFINQQLSLNEFNPYYRKDEA
jgi:hypothetical protein